MLLHERPMDRENMKTSPGPVYMTNEQFAEYLKNLRSSRVGRPKGARPLSSIQSDFNSTNFSDNSQEPLMLDESSLSSDKTIRSSSALSHRRSPFSSSYPSEKLYLGCRKSQNQLVYPSEVFPRANYIERRQRCLEREEAISLREAMEDMNINEKSDEFRIFAAAQKEASDLVWQHQNPDFVVKSDQPYNYKNYLQENSHKQTRPRSIYNNGRISPAINPAKDGPFLGPSLSKGPRSYYECVPRGRSSICSSDLYGLRQKYEENGVDGKNNRSHMTQKDLERTPTPRKSFQGITHGIRRPPLSRSNSGRGRISGDVRSSFYNGEQIYEESELDATQPESPQNINEVPLSLRVKSRNPLNRVQFSPEVEIFSDSSRLKSSKNTSNDVQKNIPSQTLSSSYISNPPTVCRPKNSTDLDSTTAAKVNNGLEIRSDEIKQATSMLLKYRSPKLPIPSVVSDKPGRPIVSFDSNWKPKEADLKPEIQRIHPKNAEPWQGLPEESNPKVDKNTSPTKHIPSRPPNKVISFYTKSTTYDIENSSSRSLSLDNLTRSSPTPIIQVDESPSRSRSDHDVPAVIIDAPENKSKRALPPPSSNRRYNLNPSTEFSQGHWSPAFGKRSTVTCHQCDLPIENRVLKIGGNEHFHPECFSCSTCGTGLESLEIYPEPCSKRMERLERIKRRAKGEILPEIEGMTKQDDGDEKHRYYCHLDFHENFAPRCKHCKTPIIGEHLVALGEHWHHGHFFCAECGDPFDKGATHIEKDGYAWCLCCQTKRTERRAPKCQKCKKSVVGQYIQALGGEWHEDCFLCTTCKNGFNDGSFYPKQIGDETVVLCTECAERELKA